MFVWVSGMRVTVSPAKAVKFLGVTGTMAMAGAKLAWLKFGI